MIERNFYYKFRKVLLIKTKQGGISNVNGEKATLARRRGLLKKDSGNRCKYCRKDFSDQPSKLTIHHRDFRGYAKYHWRDPLDPKIAVPVCENCHILIHIAASTITLGLMKSIPIGLIRSTLANEAGLNNRLVNQIIKDLKKIGISKHGIGYASHSVTRRILHHSFVEGYFDDMDEMLGEAVRNHPRWAKPSP